SDEVAPVRLAPTVIENLFGDGAIAAGSRGENLESLLKGHRQEKVELYPYFMIGILLLLPLENLPANRFYRRSAQEAACSPPSPSRSTRLGRRCRSAPARSPWSRCCSSCSPSGPTPQRRGPRGDGSASSSRCGSSHSPSRSFSSFAPRSRPSRRTNT